jgi:hypothetical protein
MITIHVLAGPEETACGLEAGESLWSSATVIEALEAASEVRGRVCRACLAAHGFDVAAGDGDDAADGDGDDDHPSGSRDAKPN